MRFNSYFGGLASALLILYFAGYIFIRLSWVEQHNENPRDFSFWVFHGTRWDAVTYVIFPKDPKLLWYVYRPMMYLDAAVTGQQFHLGPHI